MSRQDMILFNFHEIRRRSIMVWNAIPNQKLSWRPDEDALSCSEMIRHILESEFLYHKMLILGGSRGIDDVSNPFDNKEFISVKDELTFTEPFRKDFLKYIGTLPKQDLDTQKIVRDDVGYTRTLGDMVLRIAYHESVHTGQLLDYMRRMEIDRPNIWD